MAYYAPYIDAAGFHMPNYTETRDHLLAEYRRIFGDDVYLGNDSQDYELISIFALKVYDAMQAAQLAYNSRSPRTSIGSALDGIVAVNGLRRKGASYSTVELELYGVPDTVIYNGIVSDDKGARFILPAEVTIGQSNTVLVQAACTRPGPTKAMENTLTKIETPTRGWFKVTNPKAAVVGSNTETDLELRARQAISTAKPSNTVLQGTIGGIAEIEGVGRYRVYENDTNIPDANGIPGHTISAVVENGPADEIAQAIYLRKTPGTGTWGDTTVIVPGSVTGENPIDISFWRPAYVPIKVHITVKPLLGWTSLVAQDVRDAVAEYLSGLAIGDDLAISTLWAAAMNATPDLKTPAFSITALEAGPSGGTLNSTDIPIAYNQVTQCFPDYVTITEI